MLPGRRCLLLCIFPAVLLCGCGSSSYSSTRGTSNGASATAGTGTAATGNPAPSGASRVSGTEDVVVATASAAGIAVAVGATRTINVTFTSSDGLAISGFGLSGNLAMLPPGWSGPAGFSCASLSIGSGCVLNLTYAPAALDSGTLTLDCVFVDNATMPRTPGPCLNIAYAATAQNNVVSSISPTGQINAVAGMGSATVNVNFTTDDGDAATDFSLSTDVSSLPSGWSTAAAGLSCAIVSTGNGCQLALIFAPMSAAHGTLTLNYDYTDGSGAAKTGALNIPYATASRGTVIATASPSGQINAVQKTGGQAVAVSFTTDDGKPARNLQLTSSLTSLPAGWHSTSGHFTCGSVSTGNGCQLPLTYAPSTVSGGTLALNYAYEDEGGAARSGLLDLAYAATTNDNVVGTASPSGQINAIAGGAQAVAVTFTTDDGRPATALQVSGSLATLPAGWSSTDSSFTCSGLSSGSGCQLALTYAPAAADSGLLMLSYTYNNNAGISKNGSLNIPYRATTDDNVAGAPSQGSVAVLVGSSTNVDVTFTTDDTQLATGLMITSGLALLPPGWSSTANSFSCSSVSVGTACRLSLTYAPTTADSGSLNLGFSYTNNSGIVKTGTSTIIYAAAP